LLEHQEQIELSAIQTAREAFNEPFNLVLYDVTTLYFESFKEYDFQSTGFSKDNKPPEVRQLAPFFAISEFISA
jgi:hypothetical protein